MIDRLTDRMEIATLMAGWLSRDLAQWDKLAALFQDNAMIEITWFRGTVAKFVEGSRNMGASDLVSRHLIGAPQIQFQAARALVETPTVIVVQNSKIGLGATTQARFLDRVEQSGECWQIAQRHCSYDISTLDFPRGLLEIDLTRLDRHPPEYAPLAYMLEGAGFPINGPFPTRGSKHEADIKKEAALWLKETERS